MIKRVFSPDELTSLPSTGIEAQKIRSLLLAYGTNYDFCRFYLSEDAAFCELNGGFVLCDVRKSGEYNIEELSGFFAMRGFSEIFCPLSFGEPLSKRLDCEINRVNLMRFCGDFSEKTEIDTSPPLDEIFHILNTAFDIDYEQWYVDMSHRIRHNISRARKLDGSALVIQHDLNGEVLLSQIATVPERRGTGGASRLIKAVCAELSGSAVYALCEDKLLPFYVKTGFVKESDKLILRSPQHVK